ncbi:MAG: type II toxin-antitoxin system RelE/ParE family toxin [Chitinophagaceae bacterium]
MPRFKVAYSPESLQEIKRIIHWYNEISPGLGDRFRKNLLTEIAALKQNPFTRSFRYNEVRFAVVKKFPYAAHYTIEEKNRLIKIQAVLGFAQDAETNWKMRF